MNEQNQTIDATATLVIADDHPIVRQGLRLAIERDARYRILAEAGDGETAVELVEKLRPAAVILDVDMPRRDGFSAARAISERFPDVKIVFLTFHDEEDYLHAALEAGASGYLLKDGAINEIINCLDAVLAGKSYVTPTLTTYLVSSARRPSAAAGIDQLSPTERQILRLLAEYKTSKEIAAELFVSPHTVNTHRANIAVKLDLRGSHALMKFALDNKAKL